jgi:hypothetical protein
VEITIVTEAAETATDTGSGLIRSRSAILAARSRTGTRSDGGSTGRSDTND